MTQTPTDALRLVPVPYVVLSEAAGLLDCESYGPLALTLNNILAAAPASPLPGGGTSYAAGGLDVLSRILSRLNEQIDRAEADLNSTVTIRLNDAKAVRHMLAAAAPTGDA